MLSSSLCASLIVLVISTVATSAAPSLTIKTSTHNINVDGLENLKVTTTVTNVGDETLKLLNDPRGVLNTFPGNTFTITRRFSPVVKYSPTYAAGLDDPSVFTVLDPGASINVTHDLSAAYNFTRSGVGAYSVEPSNLFTYIDADGIPKNTYATVGDIAEVKLSGNLAVSRVHNKRATFTSCPWAEQLLLKSAAASAQAYASNTYNYINHLPRSTSRYETWFGAYHVDPEEFGITYPCSAFWKAENTGTDSRAGTLIHESSHFIINGHTADYTYGQAAAKQFAIDYPGLVTENADSHQYFAENNPFLS